jgi:sulfur carrier protein
VSGARITLTVNGDPLVLDAGATVTDLVARVAASPKGIAVAINADVVPRSEWPATEIGEGDRVELLTAAQGG